MDVDKGQMNFTPDEQRAGEMPASSSVDHASILNQKLYEVLDDNREKLLALQTADDDEILATERAQIGSLIKKVLTIKRLTREVGDVLITQEIQSFQETDGS